LLLPEGQVHHDTHPIPMGNYVIAVGNYVSVSPSDLGNYVSADMSDLHAPTGPGLVHLPGREGRHCPSAGLAGVGAICTSHPFGADYSRQQVACCDNGAACGGPHLIRRSMASVRDVQPNGLPHYAALLFRCALARSWTAIGDLHASGRQVRGVVSGLPRRP
jgi:hypothetical protein